jgi:hypothetical protein
MGSDLRIMAGPLLARSRDYASFRGGGGVFNTVQ